ncbi:MAG: SHOCT domain-containing protein [Vulcanimicrobiaceae bacterium]
MRRRIGRPSLLGTAARTAVIAGTATATMNAVGGAGRAPQPQAAPPPAAAAGGLTEETLSKLKQLGELHASGVLNEQEFAQAKAKLLG